MSIGNYCEFFLFLSKVSFNIIECECTVYLRAHNNILLQFKLVKCMWWNARGLI